MRVLKKDQQLLAVIQTYWRIAPRCFNKVEMQSESALKRREDVRTLQKPGKTFFSELFTHVGQWGTHVDTTKEDYSLETYILGTNHYQIELLTNLDQVPEAGALVVVNFPKPKGGSGFPARVFAILP